MVRKKDIRRAVHVTCVLVGGGSEGVVPSRVTLRVKHRRGYWPRPAASRQVAVFTFGERPRQARLPVSVTAPMDLEHLYKVQRKASASAAEVKVCVEHPRVGRRVARVGLDDFLGQLMRSGLPEWSFLYVHEEKVTLVQANHPMPGDVPEWLFDGTESGSQTGKGVMSEDKREESAPEMKEEHEKGNGTASEDKALEDREQEDNDKVKASEKRAENGDTKDSPEYTGEECTRDRDRVMVEDLEHTGEECGRDRDESDKEYLEDARENCERDGDEEDQASIDHSDESEWQDCENGEWEDTKDGSEDEEAARDWNVGTEEGAKALVRSEEEGEKKRKAAAGVSMGGGHRFLSGAWRLARRVLVVTCVVVFVMIILDLLLPPHDDEEVEWRDLAAEISEIWGLEEGRSETRGYVNTKVEEIVKKDL